MHRVFAWMTYLNDVKDEDGGTTNFDYYKITPPEGFGSVVPEKFKSS